MKRMIILVLTLLSAMSMSAGTPAEVFMDGYGSVKGAKIIKVQGRTMVFARPVIKRYPIGPMADLVEEVSLLNMEKVSDLDKQRFISELEKMLGCSYQYYGKSDSPNGPVDVYVHLADNDTVDELVIYNPASCVLNSLIGNFSVAELLALDSQSRK